MLVWKHFTIGLFQLWNMLRKNFITTSYEQVKSVDSQYRSTVAYFAHDRCYANMNSLLFEINRLIIDGKVTKVFSQ